MQSIRVLTEGRRNMKLTQSTKPIQESLTDRKYSKRVKAKQAHIHKGLTLVMPRILQVQHEKQLLPANNHSCTVMATVNIV